MRTENQESALLESWQRGRGSMDLYGCLGLCRGEREMLSFYLRATWSPAYSWLGSRQRGLSSPAPLSPEDRPPQSQVSYFPQKVLSQGWLVPRGGLAQASRGARGPHTSCLACLTHTHTHTNKEPQLQLRVGA